MTIDVRPAADPISDRAFATDQGCADYIVRRRWPEGRSCHHCRRVLGRDDVAGRVLRCGGCGRDMSILAGTTIGRSHASLVTWFHAASLVVADATPMRPRRLQGPALGVSYETAGLIVDRFRRAMAQHNVEPLHSSVLVLREPLAPAARRQAAGAAPAALVALELDGPLVRRVRAEAANDPSLYALAAFAERVAPGVTPIAFATTEARDAVASVLGAIAAWVPRAATPSGRVALANALVEFGFRWERRDDPLAAVDGLLGLTGTGQSATARVAWPERSA